MILLTMAIQEEEYNEKESKLKKSFAEFKF